MKNLVFAVFAIFLACCCASTPETPKEPEPVVQQEEKPAPVTEPPTPPEPVLIEENGKEFTMSTWNGISWGSTISQFGGKESVEELHKAGIAAKLYEDKLVARGDTSLAFAPQMIMVWGFDKGRLVYGVNLYVAPSEQIAPLACNAILGSIVEEHGPPHAQLYNDGLIWQNENTTLTMFCTNYGPVLDWYHTLWLRHNKSFVAHSTIPEEALSGDFGKEVPRKSGNPTKREGQP